MNDNLVKNEDFEVNARIRSLEFATSMYRNADGGWDTKADGFISFANQVYKYLKNGSYIEEKEPPKEAKGSA